MKRITIIMCAAALLLIAGCATATAEEPPTAKYGAFVTVNDVDEPAGAVRVMREIEARQAEQAEAEAAADEVVDEGEWYEEECYEPTYYGNDYGNPFKQEGVTSDENYQYTWYSQNTLGGSGLDELNSNGRHVDESTGFIVDGDGYIAVAMNGVEQGTIIDTKWGEAKVYDVKDDGAPYDGEVDVYTDF